MSKIYCVIHSPTDQQREHSVQGHNALQLPQAEHLLTPTDLQYFQGLPLYSESHMRLFLRSGLQSFWVYNKALQYGAVHPFDEDRELSGKWLSAIIIARLIKHMLEGTISKHDLLEIEGLLDKVKGALQTGYWQTAKVHLSNAKLVCLEANPLYVTIIEADIEPDIHYYVEHYY